MPSTGTAPCPDPGWTVLGAGAMGSLWAARLAQQGVGVHLLARQERQGSLRLRESADSAAIELPLAQHRLESLAHPIERLLLCCKAPDALPAIEQALPHLSNNARVVLCQNGLGSQQQIIKRFPQLDIYCLSTTEGAYLPAPHEVVHAGHGQSWLGKLHASDSDHSPELVSSLGQSGLRIQHDPQIGDRLWMKLAINASINGLTALYQCRNGDLLEGEKRGRLEALSDETRSLYRQLGMGFAEQIPRQVRQVCRDTAANYSSTYQDSQCGRATELPFINGFILQQAQAIGLTMPEHKRLLEELERRGIH
ncbi:ketopantoate reductase family protein [Aestuariirhabdus litorea]|nr:2-dehydropantoate 2-reductase [Aestuariirhabdus litorea]RWW93466.1 2-dehydropantoate 2-reductase [Endozoicomonadaceae bacterium GTF-13]